MIKIRGSPAFRQAKAAFTEQPEARLALVLLAKVVAALFGVGADAAVDDLHELVAAVCQAGGVSASIARS